jgi:uncharacterized membrane protein (DUF2068 family)
MHSRPQAVAIAVVLLALLSLMNFPGPWWSLLAGMEQQPPAFIIYSGIVLGIVGLVAAVGLWMLKPWSLWTTIVVCVLNLLLGAPGVVWGPTATHRVAIAVTEVLFALLIVLVLLPSSRRAIV